MKKQKEKAHNKSAYILAGILLPIVVITAFCVLNPSFQKNIKEQEEDKLLSQMAALKDRSIEELNELQTKLCSEERFEDAAVVRDIIARKTKEQELKQSKA